MNNLIKGIATAAGHVMVLTTVGSCHMWQGLTAIPKLDCDDLMGAPVTVEPEKARGGDLAAQPASAAPLPAEGEGQEEAEHGNNEKKRMPPSQSSRGGSCGSFPGCSNCDTSVATPLVKLRGCGAELNLHVVPEPGALLLHRNYCLQRGRRPIFPPPPVVFIKCLFCIMSTEMF